MMHPNAYYKLRKCYMILLEIMVALALVTLCVLPLLAPRAFMLNEQRKLIQNMKLDHLVSLLYVEILEGLHKNEIAWNDVMGHANFPINEALLTRLSADASIPYGLSGSYRFDTIRCKTNKEKGLMMPLLNLTFIFQNEENPDAKKFIFQYVLPVLRMGPVDASSESEEIDDL